MTDENKLIALEKIKETVLSWQTLTYKQNIELSRCWPESALEALRILFPNGIN